MNEFGVKDSEELFSSLFWQQPSRYLILLACITGNSNLEPLLEGLFAQIHFFSFFLSWVSKTQPNHWTKRMANTRLATSILI